MGQTITQQTTINEFEPDTFLLKYFQLYQKHKELNKGLLVKTLVVGNEIEDEPLIFKIFPKSFLNDETKKFYAKQAQSLKELGTLVTPKRCPNISQILQIFDLPAAGVLMRQYFEFNLRDRLGREPYLSQIEKKWICFQLLYSVNQLHNCGICHGDIKLENVLLTTYHSVFLSDIALYKPTRIRIDDMGTYTHFFSNTQENKSCYLAPERLVQDSTEFNLSKSDLNPEMDVFSLGVLISEVFLEDVVIDYSKLVDLKKGNLNLNQQLKNIHNANLVDLLVKMMEPNPKNRISLAQVIHFFAYQICPISIPRMVLHLNTMIICHNYSDTDLLVGMIYRYWKQIWRCLFNNTTPPQINYSLCAYTLNKLTKSMPIMKVSIENFPLIFSLQNNTLLDKTQLPSVSLTLNNNHQCSIIIINYLLQVLLNLKYDSDMIVAIDLLKHLTLQSTDLIKIDLVVPYLIKSLDKSYSVLVQMKAFDTIMILLMSIKEEELILKSIDYKIYNYYIFEELQKVYYEGEECIRILFVSYLDSIVELENKFLYSEINSKYQFLNPISNTQFAMNTSVFIPEIFNRRENVLLAHPKEILKDYETDLNQFKQKILDIIDAISSSSSEIVIVLIKQMPQLIFFFGNKDTLKFAKIILDIFYQGNWLLQCEVIKLFPKIALISRETIIINYFYLIIETIISKNSNEILIYQILHSLSLLFKMEFVSTDRIIELCQKIMVYILHPNLLIRNKISSIVTLVVQSTPHADIYIYLWKEMKKCIDIPFIIITNDLIKTCMQNTLSRDLYQFVNEGNDLQMITDNEREILSKLINKAYYSNKNAIDAISNEVNNKVIELIKNQKDDFEVYQKNTMVKEIRKEVKMNNYTQKEDIKCVFEKILGMILFLSENELTIPKYSCIECVDYSKTSTNFYSGDLFNLKYLIKVLNITIDPNVIQKSSELNMSIDKDSDVTQASILPPVSSFYLNKSLLQWKPKGQLIFTIYPNHNHSQSTRTSVSIFKLLSCSNNCFISFDSHNKISIRAIKASEWDVSAKTVSSIISKERITTNKELICGNSNDEFLIGNTNSTSLYRINQSKGDLCLLHTFTSPNNLCCLKYLPVDQQNQSQFMSVDRRGCIKIYDIRMKQYALKYDYNTENGIVKSMSIINNNQGVLMGTSSGYLLNYDIRLNYITDVYYYSNYANSSIAGNKLNCNSITSIQNFIPDPRTEYDFLLLKSRQSSLNNYVFISTNSIHHEIGLWNLQTLKCDLLLKTNQLKRDSPSPPTIEISLPKRSKEKNKLYYHRDIKEELQKYIDNQTLQKAMRTSLINFEEDYLKNSYSVANIKNTYDNNSTINCALCPYFSDVNCNGSYILTAGNDRLIRYWAFSTESMTTYNNTNCSTVAKPNEIESNFFFRSFIEKLTVIQSNAVVANYTDEVAETTHELSITDMIFHKEGPYLVSCGLDGLIKIWK